MRSTRDDGLLAPGAINPVVTTTTGVVAPGAINPVVAVTPPADVDNTAPADSSTNTNPTASAVAPAQQTPAYQAAAPMGGDDLTLVIGNQVWDGWQRVQVTRSVDTVPANFSIQVTETYPNLPDINIKPGDACQVKLGGDLVITGFIDRYECAISVSEHVVNISGRSKSQDLVDCAAFVGGQGPTEEQYSLSGTAVGIIKQLANAYSIEVNSQAGDGPQVPQFAINFGETPWEIIDRMSKIAAVLVYDMPDGSLMVAQAGNETMSSGFTQGVNVESAQTQFTMDQRFSIYEGFGTPTAVLFTDSGGNQPPAAIATDTSARSFRKRIIVSQQTDTDGSILPKLVNWEAARRAGRSQAVQVMCDSWRDTANNLWTPNHIAPVDIPAVKVPNVAWVIGTVTYLKDERGRHANVLLMPANAFLPEPVANIGAFPTAASAGLDQNNPASQTPADMPAPSDTTTGNYEVGGAAGKWSLGH